MRLRLAPVQLRLLRAIQAAIAADDVLGPLCSPSGVMLPRLVVEGAECAPWHSLTFAGHRHRLALRLTAPLPLAEATQDRLEALLEGLSLPGREVLIEASIEMSECRLTADGNALLQIGIAALTVEE